MNEQYKEAIKRVSYSFSQKLNKISLFSMVPMLIIFGFQLSTNPIVFGITVVYLGFVCFLVFSKFGISLRMRKLFLMTDDKLAIEQIDFFIAYFSRKTFFNSLFKKNNVIILHELTEAKKIIL